MSHPSLCRGVSWAVPAQSGPGRLRVSEAVTQSCSDGVTGAVVGVGRVKNSVNFVKCVYREVFTALVAYSEFRQSKYFELQTGVQAFR